MSNTTAALGEDKLLAEVLGEAGAGDDDDGDGVGGSGGESDVVKMLRERRKAKKSKSLAHVALHGTTDAAHSMFMHADDEAQADNEDSKPSATAVTQPTSAAATTTHKGEEEKKRRRTAAAAAAAAAMKAEADVDADVPDMDGFDAMDDAGDGSDGRATDGVSPIPQSSEYSSA